MSDQNVDTTEPTKEDELTMLKERANSVGLPYHPSIGLETLRDKVNNHLRKKTLDPVTHKAVAEPKQLSEIEKREKMRKEQLKLVRVVVNNLNPNKKEWEGDIFSASNDLVGTQKKYIPYNHAAGWHIPQILLNSIRERMCAIYSTTKNKNGQHIHVKRMIKEFGIEVLPPLTPVEIEKLAKLQSRLAPADE